MITSFCLSDLDLELQDIGGEISTTSGSIYDELLPGNTLFLHRSPIKIESIDTCIDTYIHTYIYRGRKRDSLGLLRDVNGERRRLHR